jgi:hypothetical protein
MRGFERKAVGGRENNFVAVVIAPFPLEEAMIA